MVLTLKCNLSVPNRTPHSIIHTAVVDLPDAPVIPGCPTYSQPCPHQMASMTTNSDVNTEHSSLWLLLYIRKKIKLMHQLINDHAICHKSALWRFFFGLSDNTDIGKQTVALYDVDEVIFWHCICYQVGIFTLGLVCVTLKFCRTTHHHRMGRVIPGCAT